MARSSSGGHKVNNVRKLWNVSVRTPLLPPIDSGTVLPTKNIKHTFATDVYCRNQSLWKAERSATSDVYVSACCEMLVAS